MKICPRCNAQLPDDSEFCAVCGTNLKEAWIAQDQMQNQIPEKTSGKKWIVVVIIVVILAAAAAGAGIFAVRSMREKSEEAEKRAERELKDEEQDPEASDDEEEKDKEKKDTDDAEAEKESEDEDSKTKEEAAVEEKKITAADVKASLVDSANAKIADYTEIPLVSATASSVVSQEGYDNSAIVAFDGKDETSWQEGVDGYGIGEYLTAYFQGTHDVKYIALKLGNWRSDDYYYQNCRPKKFTIQISDFSAQITVPDEKKEFFVELNEEYPAEAIRITIDDVYPGYQWEDTCIAEVKLYGD